MRLGVDAAVMDGDLVAGDVEVIDSVVVSVGLAPARTGLVAVPGFVDLQVNGFAGVDLLAADEDGVLSAARALRDTGVAAWQPTLITSPEDDLIATAATITEAREHPDGADILGVHLEGPFISPDGLGTHPGAHRRDPDPKLLERLLNAGPVTCMTLAPERPGALKLIDLLHQRGVVVAAGHTNATAEEANAAFDRGVHTVTHLFNAMRRFRARDPGIVGAALGRPDVIVQIINDHHHLAPDTVRMVWQAARGRVALVTDAIAAAGLGDGGYRLGEVEVWVADGAVRRADGTLAGSVLTMPEAVRNLVEVGAPLAAAIDAATAVPARVLGRADLGRLQPGFPANLVVIDEQVTVHRVVRDGTVTEVA